MRGSVRLHVRLVVWAPRAATFFENLAISVDNLMTMIQVNTEGTPEEISGDSVETRRQAPVKPGDDIVRHSW